ncbi:hypothetical protein GGS21DRAFT_526781 [Xylaria nigripes]|nr:hypothetical protein GGS21DRAFT_526781 [Xylaria nigripes]
MTSTGVTPHSTNPFEDSLGDSSLKENARDEWEDWDVDSDESHPPSHQVDLIDLSDDTSECKTRKPSIKSTTRMTQRRSAQLPRVKSRARQKAQNAKAGIKLVTDMSQFHSYRVVAHQRSAGATNKNRFADAVALRALEGQPSSPSIGSFAWLKRRPGNIQNMQPVSSTTQHQSPDLSPDSRPIVIGFSVPSEDVASHQVSPHTAVIETPSEMPCFPQTLGGNFQQQRSVWSPDTEVSESPYSAARSPSSTYSHQTAFSGPKIASDVPPVPELPVTMSPKQSTGMQDQHDDDSDTTCTPFEEDGKPVVMRESQKLETPAAGPESANSRAHGWWDHVTTPFVPLSNNPFKNQPQQITSSSTTLPEWWNKGSEKTAPSSSASHLATATTANHGGESSSVSNAIAPGPATLPSEPRNSEKSHVLLEESQSIDAPPPYEAPRTQADSNVVFFKSHVGAQPIPSPRPMTPGIPGTMTSQAGTSLNDFSSTASGLRPVPSAVLPDRAAGSYRTGDHFHDAAGAANKLERQRRRHEKEDIVARKVGGFWRGRGCIPEDGCFGRSGREGRKRRRICLGILGGVIAAIILIVVLVVVLTRRAMSPAIGKAPTAQPAPESTDVPGPGYWLNLTDFPPMPTGVLTITRPDNPVYRPGCFSDNTPTSAWSCALPWKDHDHDSASPSFANEPNFIFQIQYDNNTQALWKLPDEAGTSGHERRSSYPMDKGFNPDPKPPSLEEIRFLGNTTDGIKSARKEGEPTPFYISLLESINKTVGPDMLMRRQSNAIGGSSGSGAGDFNLSTILPAPALNPDGTGAPAQLFPLPVQQPLRLFDRDLPTEHYGFYTYFDKTIYLKNSTHLDPADQHGGVTINDAHSLVTFAQTRFLVKIWTRRDDLRLIEPADPSVNLTASPLVQPGSMPYPVTVVEDSHGGNPSAKVDFTYGVRSNMEIEREVARQVVMNLEYEGTLVNWRGDGADFSLGGIDGGTGGCRCEWINYEE